MHENRGGYSIVLSSPDNPKITTDSILMFAYALKSELELKVLVIDATTKEVDSSVTAKLGLRGMPGYSELLDWDADPGQVCMYHTKIPDVYVMPKGRYAQKWVARRDAEVAHTLNRAISNFDVVLIQQPCVLEDTRCLALSSLVNLNLLVVEDNKTHLNSLEACKDLYYENGIYNFGLILSA